MKKFLVLALVLGIASLSSATLSLSVAPDNSYVSIVGSDFTSAEATGMYLAFTMPSQTPTLVYIQNSTIEDYTAAVGGLLESADFLNLAPGSILSVSYVLIADTQDPMVIPNGELVRAGISGYGMVYLTDDAGGLLSSVNVVPEPMTIALLGLGGLFLRRKK